MYERIRAAPTVSVTCDTRSVPRGSLDGPDRSSRARGRADHACGSTTWSSSGRRGSQAGSHVNTSARGTRAGARGSPPAAASRSLRHTAQSSRSASLLLYHGTRAVNLANVLRLGLLAKGHALTSAAVDKLKPCCVASARPPRTQRLRGRRAAARTAPKISKSSRKRPREESSDDD